MVIAEPCCRGAYDLRYDPQFGARPMKRVSCRKRSSTSCLLVLPGTFTAGDTIYVDEKEDELTFSKDPFKACSTR